ncbi:hypothetical protein F8M41_023853 [Gigaspora margarita]|uniref:Uncharacterized protein n=1 Tax=Gigaspora margarita TaxID=4874 RepID=A0A8H4B0T0_GIGMA|nr:hypothetical protein F8M41_023853 [Gigaspora margarita]
MGSFMGIEFSNAEKESRRSISQIQKRFIYEYANIEGSSLTSKTKIFDYKFKDNLNIRYEKFKVDGNIDEIDFIWTREEHM